jgi:hypothetical protein
VQDGLIEDYYGQGRHAHKLIVDLQESQAMRTFLAVSATQYSTFEASRDADCHSQPGSSAGELRGGAHDKERPKAG